MPLILPGNVASAVSGAYEVANSCRFNDNDSPLMHKTPGSASDRTEWTLSMWFKRGNLGSLMPLFVAGSDGNNADALFISAADDLEFQGYSTGYDWRFVSDRKFRDCSAWYHIVCSYDSDDGTAGDRIKIYINGVQETSWSSQTNPSSGHTSDINSNVKHIVGSDVDTATLSNNYWDGYIAEVVFIDGSALAATSFGEFDEDSPTIWKPIDVSGLTFGTNGFYCDFEASDNLGNDANGGTDLTESGLAAADQSTDTPTNNFAVFNPLMNQTAAYTFSEGNCKVVTTSGDPAGHYACSTIAPSKGKWYFEMKVASSSGYDDIGLVQDSADIYYSIINDVVGEYGNGIGYNSDGTLARGSDESGDAGGSFDTFTDDDIIGCYVDLDNHEFYVAKNGTIQNSGTGITIDTTSATDHGVWFLAVGDQVNSAAGTLEVNFGGCSAFTVSSGNADANGYGNFEYNPSTGTFDSASKNFLALCTKNLAENG